MAEELRSPAITAESGRGGTRRARRQASRGGGAAIANGLVVVALLGLLAAGWFIFEQHEELLDSRKDLVDARNRIGALEDRLRLTDETLSESDADTSQQLSFWETEIRKVWDIANKRNRGWIETNRANIAELVAATGNLEGTLNTLQSTASRLEAAIGQQQEVADRVTAVDMQLQRLVQQQRDLVDKANAATQIANGLKADLSRRVEENEAAIAAFDTQRRELQAAMLELRNRNGGPSTPSAEPSSSLSPSLGAGQ